MPELPEVETVKRVLEPQLMGQTISALTINRPEVLVHPTPNEFENLVLNACIKGMNRRGKFLYIILENKGAIILHLRMTGQLIAAPLDYPREKHTHIVFHLENGNELRFIDTRRFGRFWFIKDGEPDTISGASRLGPEPFDESFTAHYLAGALGKRRKSIKECLLDQHVVAGIGNIYGDEILFLSKISPVRPACTLQEEDWAKLAETIPLVLNRAIERNTITPAEYLKASGSEYRSDSFLEVYGREGEACSCCGSKIQRTVLSGRSCCYCPECQV